MKGLPHTITIAIAITFLLSACHNNDELADAYGNFEAREVMISARMPGELVRLKIEEGMTVDSGITVGVIDTTTIHLSRGELIARRKAVRSKYSNIDAQLSVLEEQLRTLRKELERVNRLVEVGAATPQQRDDLEGKLSVLERQKQTILTQNPVVAAELEAIAAKKHQLDENRRNSLVINPVNGVVLTKFAEEHELVSPGKPLYTIAKLDELNLIAYISGKQLTSFTPGKRVSVKVDGPDGRLIEYEGIISWISPEAEFTPKTIQTREERVDLVYAIKVRVKNDGRLVECDAPAALKAKYRKQSMQDVFIAVARTKTTPAR